MLRSTLRTTLLASSLLTAAGTAFADDYPPGPGTPGIIEADGAVLDAVFDFPGDVDAVQIFLPVGGPAFVFTVATACHNKTLRLYDNSFRLLKTSLASTIPEREAVIEYKPKSPGLHYLQVTEEPAPDGSHLCSEPSDPGYRISSYSTCLGNVGTKCDINLTPKQRNLERDDTMWGAADRNYYRFVAWAPRAYHIWLEGGGFEGAGPVITLRDRNNKFITDNTVDPTTPQGNCIMGEKCLTFTVCPGTYYIGIRQDDTQHEVGYILSFSMNRGIDHSIECPPPA